MSGKCSDISKCGDISIHEITARRNNSERERKMENIKGIIKFTLQVFISIFIALEIAIPPNPYKTHLIVLLFAYITLKHGVVEKIEKLIKRIIEWTKV